MEETLHFKSRLITSRQKKMLAKVVLLDGSTKLYKHKLFARFRHIFKSKNRTNGTATGFIFIRKWKSSLYLYEHTDKPPLMMLLCAPKRLAVPYEVQIVSYTNLVGKPIQLTGGMD